MGLFKQLTNYSLFFIALGFAMALFQCKPDEEMIDPGFMGGLQFSADTVLFDTVFTSTGSATRRLRVYNPSKSAQQINRISVGRGSASAFNVFLNGRKIESEDNFVLLGKDSVMLLIDVLIEPQNENNPYLVTDSIVFETNGNVQDVKLVAWGQDAVYLGNEVLECGAVWTADRPYVLYAPVLVDTLCTLTIQKGARIFAGNDVYLYVRGTMIAEGIEDERIAFSHIRQEPRYDNVPGQWGGLIFLEGTYGNILDFCIIRNATYGIRLGAPDADTIPDVIVRNTIIENISRSGILSFTSDLYAENTLVNNCLEFACANVAGGNFTFLHCTFANYSTNFFRQSPGFFISDNLVLDDGSSIISDISVVMQNSIVYGDLDDELFISVTGTTNVQLVMNNNILKSTIEALDTLGNMLNADPRFIDFRNYNYRLDTLSPAKDTGIPIGIIFDLDGNGRDELPDIGAYERME